MIAMYLPSKQSVIYTNSIHITAAKHHDSWTSIVRDAANDTTIYIQAGDYSDTFSAQILNKTRITIIVQEPERTTFGGSDKQAQHLFDIVNSSYIHLYGIRGKRCGLFRLAGQNKLSGHPDGEVAHHIYAEACKIEDCETNSVVYTGPNNHHISVKLCNFERQKLLSGGNQEWGWYMLGFALALIDSRIHGMVKGNFVVRGHRPLNHLEDWNVAEKFDTTSPSKDVVMDKDEGALTLWDSARASHHIEGCVFDGVQQHDYHALGEFFIGYDKKSSENHYLPAQNPLIKSCYFSGEQAYKKGLTGGAADNMPYGAIKLEASYGFPKGVDGSRWRTHRGLDAKGVIRGARFEGNFSQGKLLRIVDWVDWMDSKEAFQKAYEALNIPYVTLHDNHENVADIDVKIKARLATLKALGCPID